MRGVVTRFNEFRGYGFIKSDSDDDNEYFVHWSFIDSAGYKNLCKGDLVEFTPAYEPKGLQAQHVKIVEQKNDEPLMLKPNPFTPQQPITNPDRFAGREVPIINAVDCIFNHKNILITGERGIGKSSLAFQLSYLAGGEDTLLKRLNINTGNYQFQYLCPDHRCIPGHNLFNIIESLILSAVRALGIELSYEKITTELGIDVKFVKAIQKSEVENRPSNELITFFVDAIERIYSRSEGKFNGILFLIDEIDCLEDGDNLAAFLKASIESLNFKNYGNISFILAGVTGTLTELLLQHQSFSRLFENIELKRMTESELSEIITKSLAGTQVVMDSDVKTQVINLSDRFPEPIHLLGYHCFRFDQDMNIDHIDFERALNFIIRELKKQEFDNLYAIAKNSFGYPILKKIAYMKKSYFTVSDLSNELDVKESKVAGFIGDMVGKSIIIKAKGRLFRLKEPLFRIYLKWVL
ncbi:MAG: cold shock domain-containing protein [Candidatus Electrothrix sp. GW3-4]|uniref:cold shock domain-containing protein n=1 Tax=Candidatus Electrothrix sp. GW3-4 TaxID=3126740 RepID=UPI0030CEDD54